MPNYIFYWIVEYGADILVWVFCIVIGCVLWRVFTDERNEME